MAHRAEAGALELRSILVPGACRHILSILMAGAPEWAMECPEVATAVQYLAVEAPEVAAVVSELSMVASEVAAVASVSVAGASVLAVVV